VKSNQPIPDLSCYQKPYLYTIWQSQQVATPSMQGECSYGPSFWSANGKAGHLTCGDALINWTINGSDIEGDIQSDEWNTSAGFSPTDLYGKAVTLASEVK
jgi:hypothetical protein